MQPTRALISFTRAQQGACCRIGAQHGLGVNALCTAGFQTASRTKALLNLPLDLRWGPSQPPPSKGLPEASRLESSRGFRSVSLVAEEIQGRSTIDWAQGPLSRSLTTTPLGPHPAPARLRRRGATSPSPLPSRALLCSERLLQPGCPGLRGTGAWPALRPRFRPTRLPTRFPYPSPPIPLVPAATGHYHCGCTVQAERPATPARENMVAPAPLKVGQTGLTAHARKLRYVPRPPPVSLSLASSRRTEGSLASFRRPASRGPASFRLAGGVCPSHSRLPCSASGRLGAGPGRLLWWSRWGSQIFSPRRLSPTGSSPRGFRSCAGIARCARSSAGTR